MPNPATQATTLQKIYLYQVQNLLIKRESKNKNIKNNAANYISLRTNFNILNNLENGEIYFHTLTPTYGIRRNITSHFNLELSFGYGISYSNSLITLEAMPSFRVGYVF